MKEQWAHWIDMTHGAVNLQGCFAVQENTRTSPAWFGIGWIGCTCHSASNSNCVWWCIKRCMDWLLHIYLSSA